jgi:DNA-binding NarL/FixJ family response regulator
MSMLVPIRVVLVDEHPILRAGVRAHLLEEPGIQVVGEVGSGGDLAGCTDRLRPDVLILDPEMEGLDAAALARDLTTSGSQTRVLVFIAAEDESASLPVLEAGATGYLRKSSPLQRMIEAIRTVAVGGLVFDGRSPAALLKALRDSARPSADPRALLTDREREVLGLTAQGYSAQIAEILALPLSTVSSRRVRCFRKPGGPLSLPGPGGVAAALQGSRDVRDLPAVRGVDSLRATGRPSACAHLPPLQGAGGGKGSLSKEVTMFVPSATAGTGRMEPSAGRCARQRRGTLVEWCQRGAGLRISLIDCLVRGACQDRGAPQIDEPMAVVVPGSQRIGLRDLDRTGIRGEVVLTPMHPDVRVDLVVHGARPHATKSVHVHSGRCDVPGPAVEPLEPIWMDGRGSGASSATAEVPPAVLFDEPHSIELYQADRGDDGTPVACADIPGGRDPASTGP